MIKFINCHLEFFEFRNNEFRRECSLNNVNVFSDDSIRMVRDRNHENIIKIAWGMRCLYESNQYFPYHLGGITSFVVQTINMSVTYSQNVSLSRTRSWAWNSSSSDPAWSSRIFLIVASRRGSVCRMPASCKFCNHYADILLKKTCVCVCVCVCLCAYTWSKLSLNSPLGTHHTDCNGRSLSADS